MKGSLCHEYETGIPAEEVGQVYGALRVGQLILQLLPPYIPKCQIGGGRWWCQYRTTVLHITFTPGIGMDYYKKKFIKIDNENYIKEAKGVEGGFLDAGSLSYLVRIKIIPEGSDYDSSIIRSTIEYETDDKCQVNASLISTDLLATIADATTKYLKEHQMEELK